MFLCVYFFLNLTGAFALLFLTVAKIQMVCHFPLKPIFNLTKKYPPGVVSNLAQVVATIVSALSNLVQVGDTTADKLTLMEVKISLFIWIAMTIGRNSKPVQSEP